MGSFKNEILHALKKSNSTNEVLDKISNYQNVLMKNYNNQILSKEIKNKILDIHTELQNLGKAIYRCDKFAENNFENEFNTEIDNVKELLLKVGISNLKYIWHSEKGEHTCDECAELDGQEFDMFDDIPEKPHPNCQCTIERIEDNNINLENIIEFVEKLKTLLKSINNFSNSRKLFELSISDIKSANGYKNETIEIKNNVDSLCDNELIIFLRSKLSKQLGLIDSKGVIFKENSDLSQRIKKSEDFKNHIKQYKSKLLKNKEVNKTTIEFTGKDYDLFNSLHYADVYKMNIDLLGDLHAIIIDTYDFNKGESNPDVKFGRFLQNIGLAKKYYEVIYLKVPYSDWINL